MAPGKPTRFQGVAPAVGNQSTSPQTENRSVIRGLLSFTPRFCQSPRRRKEQSTGFRVLSALQNGFMQPNA